MRLYAIYLFIFFACLSCSVYEYNSDGSVKDCELDVKIKAVDPDHVKIIKDDLRWLCEIEQKGIRMAAGWSQFIKSKENTPRFSELLKNLKQVEIHRYHCAPGQIACAFPNDKGHIYLRPFFFRQHQAARISTLLHESYHHLHGFQHVSCEKRPSWGEDCDESPYSAYGVEAHFFSQVNRLVQDKAYLKNLIASYNLHINSL